ncbi:Gfo/Idh/MocA family protein [Vibrio hippocampi]|uniref:Scyllo-inositol 2-dehydrogenase (NADP(+)) IolU n=1 Tax=Vibrio hippocampi TaxID=654686 RepID=A0ABN8DME1_9VIBR|nr:Gfo/Idh/MocA family oxidoreductase [Vibrio hippocampi]CAH0528827.1 scyllo-inositol 2-dehydrogenase (NADP(+)) IolU [Vibrio hippocampi]
MVSNRRKPIMWGIIGPGKIANNFVSAFSAVNDGCVYAVASRSRSRSQKFAQQHNIPVCYDNYEQLLQDNEVDIVYISTPNHTHYQLSKLALENGKSVLCEKPLTMTYVQSKTLFELAKQKNLLLVEGLWTRFLPAWQWVKKAVVNGEIGIVTRLDSTFGFTAPKDENSRLLDPVLGGGAIYDIGIYCISLTDYLLDRAPTTMKASITKASTGVDFSCDAELDFGGVVSTFTCSFECDLPNTFTIIGSRGSILIESNFWQATAVSVSVDNHRSARYEFPLKHNGFEYEISEINTNLLEASVKSRTNSDCATLRCIKVIEKLLTMAPK